MDRLILNSAEFVKTSVTTTDNSPQGRQDYTHLDDQTT